MSASEVAQHLLALSRDLLRFTDELNVNTGAYGWRWLCRVYRRRWYGDVIGCPDGWEYLPMWRESLAPGLYRRVTPDELGGE